MRTGVIGLGAMGAPMANNLARAGLLAAVWNRSAAKAQAFAEADIRVAADPAELAAACDVVLISVSQDADVLEVIDRLLPGLAAGKVVVDTSTVASHTAVEAARRVAQTGADFLDAPVSGGAEGARQAGLAMMVGGDAAVLERVRAPSAAIFLPFRTPAFTGAGCAQRLSVIHVFFLLALRHSVLATCASSLVPIIWGVGKPSKVREGRVTRARGTLTNGRRGRNTDINHKAISGGVVVSGEVFGVGAVAQVSRSPGKFLLTF